MTQLTHSTSDWEKHTFPIIIFLHNFNITMNIGSVFRLADAFGCEQLCLSGTSATPPNRKLTRTSRSAEKYVPFTYIDEPLELLKGLQATGYQLISLELTTNSQPLSELLLPKAAKVCLILGSENSGVDADFLALSDEIVHIPMHGEVSSLNVATAAGIALYEIVNQLK